MKKLKIILQSNIFYFLVFIFLVIYIFVFTILIKHTSNFSLGYQTISGIVYKYSCDSNQTIIYIKEKNENVKLILNEVNHNIKIGSKIVVYGLVEEPSNNTIFNTYNYKKYLYTNKIYRIVNVTKIIKIENNQNIFQKIKNYFIGHCKNKYVSLFILGDKFLLEDEIYNNYKNIGIAHLFAISGMHISLLILVLKKILFFIKEKIKIFILVLVLLLYAYIVDFSPSVLRAILFFFISSCNQKYIWGLNGLKCLFITFFVMVFFNPLYIYQLAFQYSFSCLFGILLCQKYFNNNYLFNILKISIITLLFTLPINVSINYEINLISIVANIIFIPFVTYIFYPICILTFLFSFLLPVLSFLAKILEIIAFLLSKVRFLIISFPKINILFWVGYYVFLFLFFRKNNYKYFFSIMFFFFFVKFFWVSNNLLRIYLFDVGQGDAILISSNNENILIDTGYKNSLRYILFFKSIGLKKIKYLILSHGDFDHMGEAINLVENFKVENVIFNCGEYNDLEQKLIKVLDKNKINYYSCIKELYLDKYKLQFLNTKEYDNENDNSNVIYFNYDNNKFLFMGDAGVEKEKDILDKYNLKDIDFLKVGHHGSNTSSSDHFIDKINPKYSLISVGKNNRYGHPKDEVLETLSKSKIYRTDLDGSIEIKLNKNGYKIRTCPP